MSRFVALVGNHSASVTSSAFSPDGSRVVSAGFDKKVMLWKVNPKTSSWVLLGVVGLHDHFIVAVVFSPDGRRVASGSVDGAVKIWNVASRNPSKWGLQAEIGRHAKSVTAIAYSSNGNRLATTSLDKNVFVWNVAGDNPQDWGLMGLAGRHNSYAESVAFSPEGSCIVSGGDDKTIKVWDVVGPDTSLWGLLADLGTHGKLVSALTFSADGKRVLSGGYDKKIQIWNVSRSDPIYWGLLGHVGSHDGAVSSAAFSPNGRWVVSGGFDKKIKLWSVAAKDPEKWAFIGDVGSHGGIVYSVSFSKDGNFVLSSSRDKTVKQWYVSTQTSEKHSLIGRVGSEQRLIYSTAFSPCGRYLVSAGVDTRILVWNVTGSDPSKFSFIKSIGNHSSDVVSVGWSRDGKHIVSGSLDNTLQMFQVSGQPSAWGHGRLVGSHSSHVQAVAIAPNGKWIASGGGDNKILLWDVSSSSKWGLLKELGTHDHYVAAVQFSPDGWKIATGGVDNKVKLWTVAGSDTDKYGWLADLGSHSHYCVTLSFSPDGRFLVTAGFDQKAKMWFVGGDDASQYRPLKDLGAHEGVILSVAYSADGSYVISGGEDGKVKQWTVAGSDTRNWGFLRELGAHEGVCSSISVSSVEDRVVSAGEDSQVAMWSLNGVGVEAREVSLPEDCPEWRTWWDRSLLQDFSFVLERHATVPQPCHVIACELTPLFQGGLYPVCNVTVKSHDFLRRSEVQQGALLESFLPPFNLKFDISLVGLTLKDLPLPHRTLSLDIRDTGVGVWLDEFGLDFPGLQYTEELDLSGPGAHGSLKEKPPESLRRLRLVDSAVEAVTHGDWFLLDVLDLRNSSVWNKADFGNLIFKNGVLTCPETPRGHVADAPMCGICEAGFYRRTLRDVSCAECPQTSLWLSSGYVQILLCAGVLLCLLIAIKVMQRMKANARQLVGHLQYKVQVAILTYQKLAQLLPIARPVPKSMMLMVREGSIVNVASLSFQALGNCTLAGTQYSTYWLVVLQAGLVSLCFIVAARACGSSVTYAIRFANSLTVISLMAQTPLLFLCDNRLAKAPLAVPNRSGYLLADYRILCNDPWHVAVKGLAGLFLLIHCFGVPLLLFGRLVRSRSTLNRWDEHLNDSSLKGSEPRALGAVKDEGQSPIGAAVVHCSDTVRRRQLRATSSVSGQGSAHTKALRRRDLALLNNPSASGLTEAVSDLLPGMWWWFVVPPLSHVFVAALFLQDAEGQVYLGTLMCAACGIAAIVFNPYKRRSDGHCECICQLCVAAAFTLNAVESSPWIDKAVTGVIMSIPFALLLFYVVSSLTSNSFWDDDELLYFVDEIAVRDEEHAHSCQEDDQGPSTDGDI